MPDPKARQRIVRLLTRHQLALQGYALAITADHQLAEDACQEVAAAVFWNPAAVPGGERTLPWLREATRRKALEVARRSRRGGTLLSEDVLEALGGAFPSPAEALLGTAEGVGLRESLARCLARLAEGQRRILEGRYREGLPAEEIARRAGRSVQAIYAVLKRVRRALARCMREGLEGGEHWNEVMG